MTRHRAVHLLTVATFVVTVGRVAPAVDSTAEYREIVSSIQERMKAIETALRTGTCARDYVLAQSRPLVTHDRVVYNRSRGGTDVLTCDDRLRREHNDLQAALKDDARIRTASEQLRSERERERAVLEKERAAGQAAFEAWLVDARAALALFLREDGGGDFSARVWQLNRNLNQLGALYARPWSTGTYAAMGEDAIRVRDALLAAEPAWRNERAFARVVAASRARYERAKAIGARSLMDRISLEQATANLRDHDALYAESRRILTMHQSAVRALLEQASTAEAETK